MARLWRWRMSEQLQGNPFEGLLGGGATVGAVSKPRRRKSAKELGWQAAYRARNRERLAAYGRAYYARNREKLLAYGRQYRAQLGHLGRERLTPEQLAERERARLKSYYWNNREKVLAKAAARRMAKKAAAAAGGGVA